MARFSNFTGRIAALPLIMIKNYFLVTFRNIRRNKIFSLINIAGLSIGLSACFLIWQYVRFESSYDTFHKNKNRLFRVAHQFYRSSTPLGGGAANSPAVVPAMKADLPEVADYCRLIKTSLFTGDLSSFVANALEFSYHNDKGDLVAFNEESVWFSDASFFKLFSFPLIAGTEDALKEPNSVVVTESVARKYFGNTAALGKQLRLNRERLLTVTGIVTDVPLNSHLQFDILISFSTMQQNFGDGYDMWTWSAFYSYILLDDEADLKIFESKIPAFTKKYHEQDYQGGVRLTYFLQPITDIHLHSKFADEQSRNGDARTVYFLSLLAGFILVVGWINYINLSTAKALERSKEVGLRKTVGASRKQLIVQFLFDTTVINCLGLLGAVGISLVSWGWFERLIEKRIGDVLFQNGLMDNPTQWLMVIAVFFSVVILIGAYPAMTLSSFNPAIVLKGKFFKSPSGVRLRKLMISFQYVLAILLLAGAITIYLQVSFMRSQDPGFKREQVVIVEAPAVYDSLAGDKISFFKNNVLQIPGVKNVSASADIPGRSVVEYAPVARAKSQNDSDYFGASVPGIDTSFFSTYQIELLEGRMFQRSETMAFRIGDNVESIPVLVNEQFLKRLEISDVRDALREKLQFWWGPEMRHAEIVGVVADHHQESLEKRIEPVMYMQPRWMGWRYFSIRLESGALQSTLGAIESVHSKTFPDNSFSYFFLDEFFDNQYKDDLQFGRIFNVFTMLAIVVTCLGLIGLSIFSVSQRTKEVGIRKVLGASTSVILYLFSKDFLKVLLVSYCITVPVIYWGSHEWLQNFTFRIPLTWQMFALPPVLLIIITLVTIGVTSLKAALETPIRALRQE